SNTRGTIFGYRGIASTKDFITYTKAADDCIFSRLDAEGWDVDWHSNGSVGGGAAAYIKDGEYWYMLIESPDRSLACVEDQNWPFGLLRSKTLTNTEWDNWISNPPPELRPVGPMAEPIAAWTYPTLFEDDGITYLAITQSYPVHAYRQYRIAWKEGAEPLEKNTAERRKPATAAPPEKTGTAYEADMNSADGWKAMGKVPAGTESIFVVEGGRYRLAEDEISRAVEIDLSRNPVFSITIDEMDPPRLFVRLQVPGLAAQPGYDVGYIGFEALGFEGVSTFNINDELNWLGYFDEDASEIKNCVLNIWAHQCEAVISDIRIEYYEQG
ncbi:MAG: hypothetical protein FWH48_04425, partial [Oscillospiraceae bacterium]|nr:hypothetical protein [Oscillospiraceae bacterium]